MAIITTDSQNYTDIADAIRQKNGTSDTYLPSEMASAITNIPSGTNAAWFGGENPILLFTKEVEWALSDTNYSSLTPSTTNQYLTLPATSYSSANQNVILDRWGNGYNGGTALNFAEYNYVVIYDIFTPVVYTTEESTMALGHQQVMTSSIIIPIAQKPRYSSSIIYYPSDTVSGATSTTPITCSGYWYRTASNVQAYYTTTNYGVGGIYTTPSVSLQSSASLTPAYIYFYSGSFRVCANATYMNVSAFDYVNPDETKIHERIKLYQVDKFSSSGTQWERGTYMALNRTFPTD